jgi:hypothetical protein
MEIVMAGFRSGPEEPGLLEEMLTLTSEELEKLARKERGS